MKNWILIFVSGILVFVLSASAEKPWIGTYSLEITEKNKEMFEMFQEMEMTWPEITFKEDGTFLLKKTEGNSKITGKYTVKDTTLTIHATEVDGKPPEGNYKKSHSVEFRKEFNILMFEGADKEKWVKKEVNEAFLKKKKSVKN